MQFHTLLTKVLARRDDQNYFRWRGTIPKVCVDSHSCSCHGLDHVFHWKRFACPQAGFISSEFNFEFNSEQKQKSNFQQNSMKFIGMVLKTTKFGGKKNIICVKWSDSSPQFSSSAWFPQSLMPLQCMSWGRHTLRLPQGKNPRGHVVTSSEILRAVNAADRISI